MKKQLTAISKLHDAVSDRAHAREQLRTYIREYPLSGRKKEILLGWGQGNFSRRLDQDISDDKLIEAVERLIEHNKEHNRKLLKKAGK